MSKKEVSLKVMEALQEEAYKGIVRIDAETMKQIAVRPGDIVEIEGKRKTVGIVDRAYPTDVGESIIRMDGILRRNAKTGIGELVKVSRTEVKEAKKITIAPAQQGVMIKADPAIFRNGFLGRVVLKGDIVTLGGTKRRRTTMTGMPLFDLEDIFGQDIMRFMGSFGSLRFIVVETKPTDSPVIITENTEIKISSKPMEVPEETVPDVTYEDIGGLSEEIRKIREMVELPLKRPEIFMRLGIEPPQGVLLYGPPGCGKTLLAKAVANESQANFMLVNGPEIMNKFYGECVASDSLVLTNGAGLTTIEEATKKSPHRIAALDMNDKKVKMLPVSDKYDKGIQTTLTISTENSSLALTPTSKLFVSRDSEPEWVFVKDLKLNDKVAIAKDWPKKPISNDIVWSPIKVIEESKNHVYDFTVPKDHNFIANGFIVHNSEKRIRQIFEEAEQKAPSIIFIDEIDAIAPKREETHGEVERRVVAQLLTTMDGLNKRGKVIVIGATNRPNSIDPALRRPGRFDREISFGVPNKRERLEILKIHTRNMPLAPDVKLEELADITHGFVGADVSALAKEAAMNVLRRLLPDIKVKDDEPIPEALLNKLIINKEDFKESLKIVRPSALREVLIEKPNIKWEDIGGLEKIKQQLKEVVELPLSNPDSFKRLGIRPPRGVLLYGPPGCGKTLLAKAVANESQANFIQVKGPELISMWVGESLPYDEELIVKKNGRVQRMKIGDIVENKEEVEVLAFDKNKRVNFSRIDDYIKHPSTSQLLEITTKTGRKIKVTSDHSLFSFINGEFASIPTQYLIPNESYIAIPKRLNLPRERVKEINLYDSFKEDSSVYIGNVKDYIEKSKLILGLDKVALILEKSKEYTEHIIYRNLPVPITNFDKLIKESKLQLDLNGINIKLKGSIHSYPARFKIDKDFWRLVGLWVAEGDFNGYTVRIHNSNQEIRQDAEQICKKYNLNISKGETCFSINSLLLQKIFKQVLGLAHGAENKRVPAIVFTLDKESKANLLRGYFSGDGSIYSAERGKFQIEAGTISKTLANDLLYLLLDFGIVATMYKKKEKTGSTTYRISILGVNNFENFKDIGFIDNKRDERISKYIDSRKWSRSDLIPLSGELYNLSTQYNCPKGNFTIGKDRLKQVLLQTDKSKSLYKEYWDLAEGDIFFDKVKSVTILDNKPYVYDISVPDGQNFVAGFGGVFAHNSEKGIKKIFEKARQASPTVIFFDEIDSIASRRGVEFGTKATERMVNQLLAEMDGLEELNDVIVIAATNRPDILDPALLRSGRFDRLILTTTPDRESRLEILKIHARNMPLAKDVDLKELAQLTDGFVGSDIESLCREAAMLALRKDMNAKEVTMRHFEEALHIVGPSVKEEDIKQYQELADNYLRTARSAEIRTATNYMG